MNRLMISGFIAVALLAAAITMLPSHSLFGHRAAVTTGNGVVAATPGLDRREQTPGRGV